MRFKYALIGVFCLLSLLFAVSDNKSYKYTLENALTHNYSSLEVKLYQTLNPATVNGSSGIYTVCVGDTVDLRKYIQYNSSFQEMKIKSYCDAATTIYNCDKNVYSITQSYGISGITVLLSKDEYDIIKNSRLLSYYQTVNAISNKEKDVVNKISNANGGAWLWRGKTESNSVQIKYASSKGGFGGHGDYSVSIKKPNGTIIIPQKGQGSLHDFSSANINYKFDEEGEYTVTYNTTIKNRVGILLEQFINNNPTVIHTFRHLISGPLFFSVKEDVKFNAISSSAPSLKHSIPTIDPVLDANGSMVPNALTEGQSGTFTIRFTLQNDGTSDVTLTDIAAPKDTHTKPIAITVNSKQPSVGSGYTIKKGDKVNVVITATGTPQQDSKGTHRIRVDYTYKAAAAGVCDVDAKSKTGTAYVNIDVIEDIPQDHLHLSVLVAPPLIDASNFEKLKNVRVYGTVFLDNSVVPDGGANVTLIEINKRTWPTGCVPGQRGCSMKYVNCYKPSPQPSVKTDNTGAYSFDNVPLNCTIGPDEMGVLEAIASAIYQRYMDGPKTGTSSINTAIPDPACTLSYKRVAGASEKYVITVNIMNWNEGFITGTAHKKGTYDCGNNAPTDTGITGSLPSTPNKTKAFTFTCDYGTDLTPEMSKHVVYKLNYKKSSLGADLEMSCSADVGMCYFQLG